MWQTEAFRAQAARLETVVGGRTAKLFEPLRVRTVGEAARLVPRRYLQGAEDAHLKDLRVGDEAAFIADVVDFKQHPNRLSAVVSDGTASLSMTFFIPPRGHQWFPGFMAARLRPGQRGLFVGKVGEFRNQLQLTHPDFVTLDANGRIIAGSKKNVEMAELAGRSGLIGIYPATAKLRTWTVASTIQLVLDHLGRELPDPLPEEIVHGVDVTALARADLAIDHEPPEGTRLPDLATAFNWVHRPGTRAEAWLGRQRLLFDEAFGLLATMAYRRRIAMAQPATPRAPKADGLLSTFDARLPFELTAGQQQVGAEILADLARGHPMQRLLQGEVGSGKTLVALRAMLAVVDSGGQAALLAPTEVLAQQHHRTIVGQLGDLAEGGGLFGGEGATSVALLTGSMSAADKRRVLLQIASGEAGIVVGTHALLSEQVTFADLGLVVVDEQHRFGVEQRAALNEKAESKPHVLVMTATPIPRTVAMSVFGDLEVSTLREIPAGRSEVVTRVIAETVTPQWVAATWARVVAEVENGRQAFIVCPKITSGDKTGEGVQVLDEETESIEPRNVTDLHADLVGGPLNGLRVAALHGQLPPEEKDAVMQRFAAGELDVLVSTTVIEVGVDVPNASVMVISDADRFGVSQLHQLRGRIGRGAHPGLCVLLTRAGRESLAAERLMAVAATRDGFALAEADLAQRREGDVLGAAQAGARSGLRLLRVLEHTELIGQARDLAEQWADRDPELRHPGVADAVRQLEENAAGEWLERG
ncbi:ATP-dependent DNA helicase RecG [Granulicoccus sp. GXG6511]|uniref:ATP-dependent DNA helicase RecG n=1 Tax=Granulicoccus sp. GXG6511 TaxID=3381351 RepID=UPI003D7CFCEF